MSSIESWIPQRCALLFGGERSWPLCRSRNSIWKDGSQIPIVSPPRAGIRERRRRFGNIGREYYSQDEMWTCVGYTNAGDEPSVSERLQQNALD